MQFYNSTDTELSLVSHIDFLLFGTGSTFNDSYSLADRTRNINIAWDEVVVKLYKADPMHLWDDFSNTNFPIATATLVANQEHYDLLDAALVIHRVRVKDRQGNYKTLEAKQRQELSDSQLSSTGDPRYYYKIGGAVFPIAVPDYGYASGIEVQFQRGANHFTVSDTTKEPGFNSQFHHILAIKAAKIYAMASGLSEKTQMLNQMEQELEAEMLEFYQLRSPDERPKLSLKSRQMAVRAGLN